MTPHNSITCMSIYIILNTRSLTTIYPLSLHDALPIWLDTLTAGHVVVDGVDLSKLRENELVRYREVSKRSEEHTSELQSLTNLVCRLLLEKKKIYIVIIDCYYSVSHI